MHQPGPKGCFAQWRSPRHALRGWFVSYRGRASGRVAGTYHCDLKKVSAWTRVCEALQLLIPVHIFQFYLIVEAHRSLCALEARFPIQQSRLSAHTSGSLLYLHSDLA